MVVLSPPPRTLLLVSALLDAYCHEVVLPLAHAAEPLAEVVWRLGVPDIPSAAHDVERAVHSLRDVKDLDLDLNRMAIQWAWRDV